MAFAPTTFTSTAALRLMASWHKARRALGFRSPIRFIGRAV